MVAVAVDGLAGGDGVGAVECVQRRTVVECVRAWWAVFKVKDGSSDDWQAGSAVLTLYTSSAGSDGARFLRITKAHSPHSR